VQRTKASRGPRIDPASVTLFYAVMRLFYAVSIFDRQKTLTALIYAIAPKGVAACCLPQGKA
jgi:hypothetical protein